jgi:F0F1-type ATP synthase assembly protein I
VTAVTPDARQVALGIVLQQAILSAAIALLCWMFASPKAAFSAAIGGGIGTAASLVLAMVAFRPGERDPGRMARAFFVGEAAKLAVVVILFVLAFTTIKKMLVPVALFGAYMATFFVFWVALARSSSDSGGKESRS